MREVRDVDEEKIAVIELMFALGDILEKCDLIESVGLTPIERVSADLRNTFAQVRKILTSSVFHVVKGDLSDDVSEKFPHVN